MSRRVFCLTLILSAVFASLANAQWKTVGRVSLPEVTVRAFGTHSAEYRQLENGLSGMRIKAESPEKAALLHAKYLHDLSLGGLHLTGDVRKIIPGTYFHYYDFPGQGCVAALYEGKNVLLLTAKNIDDLKTFVHGLRRWDWRHAPEAELPLYIRARNDNPFRFYYWFNQYPPGTRHQDYRFLPEFDWAKKMGTGFVFWQNVATNDSAEGLTMLPSITWAIRAAGRRDLPVVINTCLTNNQSTNMNRFAAETMMGNPDFVGSFYCVADTSHAGVRELSWGSQAGKDEILATIQKVVRATKDMPNVVEYMEPHAEMRHANSDIYLEYGPVADASFRGWLRQEYGGDLATVSQRWHGDPNALKTWDDVRVPEIASFAGWNADALDLKGDWRVQPEPPKGDPPPLQLPQNDPRVRDENHRVKERLERAVRAPAEWFSEDFDDSAWP